MRISTRVRYGTRALLDIAEHSGNGPVSLKEISKRQKISQPYLEQLILLLKAAGYVRSIRGAKGGFLLSCDPGKVNMAQIVSTLGGEFEVVDCLKDPENCERFAECNVYNFWHRLSDAVSEILESTTLADLINGENSC